MIRLVSTELNKALKKCANANYGLMFNKYLIYKEKNDIFEPEAKEKRTPLIKQFNASKNRAASLLKKIHARQADFCKRMKEVGWTLFIFHAKLISPFVSGLGAVHPTETGMILDHITGMPFIPSSSQKGVLRLAHVINSLRDESGEWLPVDRLLKEGVLDGYGNWTEDGISKTLFGKGGNEDALSGQITILDAYPLTPPQIGEEILNPHYNDYYRGKRGPTEDQMPVPIKFLVVKPGVEFVFRVLLRFPFDKAPEKDVDTLWRAIRKNIICAIEEEGMGAKTALGFGRFEIISEHEPDKVLNWIEEEEKHINAIKDIALQDTKKILLARQWREMTAEEKEIATVRGDEIACVFAPEKDPERDIWPKLEDVEREHKMRLAEAFMKRWEKVPSKWRKKDCSKNQWEKVQKLVEILNIDHPDIMVLSKQDQACLRQIESLKDWGDFTSSNIDIEALTLIAAERLIERFKEWGCNRRNAKKNKQKAFKILKQHITGLKKTI